MKYTKKQRHQIYKKALAYINNYKNEGTFEYLGLCHLLTYRCKVLDEYPKNKINYHVYFQWDDEYKKAILPELWCFIDCGYPDLNWNERKIILQLCIEMTKP